MKEQTLSSEDIQTLVELHRHLDICGHNINSNLKEKLREIINRGLDLSPKEIHLPQTDLPSKQEVINMIGNIQAGMTYDRCAELIIQLFSAHSQQLLLKKDEEIEQLKSANHKQSDKILSLESLCQKQSYEIIFLKSKQVEEAIGFGKWIDNCYDKESDDEYVMKSDLQIPFKDEDSDTKTIKQLYAIYQEQKQNETKRK